ncbi:hypothetical protein D3C75_715170 [compost metagenome]
MKGKQRIEHVLVPGELCCGRCAPVSPGKAAQAVHGKGAEALEKGAFIELRREWVFVHLQPPGDSSEIGPGLIKPVKRALLFNKPGTRIACRIDDRRHPACLTRGEGNRHYATIDACPMARYVNTEFRTGE